MPLDVLGRTRATLKHSTSPSNPPACAPTRARGCLSAQAHKCVLPSTPPAQLIRVLLLYPRRAPNPPVRQRWQCVLYVRAAGPISVCIYTPHTASAHPPPTRAPLPSPETAPSPEGGLASPRALRPRRRCPQPSGGLHARATRNPPTRTGHEPSWGGSPPKDGFVETVVAS